MKIRIVKEKDIKPKDIININLCYYDEIIDAIKDVLTDYLAQEEKLDFDELANVIEDIKNEDIIEILEETIRMIKKYGTV